MSKEEINLRAMTEIEYNQFEKLSKSNYINDKIKANGLTLEEAQKTAEADFNRYLPDGYKSSGNFLFIIENDERTVGHLWYVIRGAENNKKAFIADIFLNENSRGRGFGRQTLHLLEDHVKKQGVSHIGLHVFGFNERAIKLYQSMGYQTTDLVMEKSL